MSDVYYADVIDADPPPRELTPTARKYIAHQAPDAWAVLAFVFLVFPGIFSLLVLHASSMIGSLVVGVLVTAALAYWAAAKRKKLRGVIVNGTQRPGRLVDVSELVLRRGFFVQGRRMTLTVEVDGQRSKCVSWAGDLDDAEQGAWIRVLVHPGAPGLVVPVVSVT